MFLGTVEHLTGQGKISPLLLCHSLIFTPVQVKSKACFRRGRALYMVHPAVHVGMELQSELFSTHLSIFS